MNLRKILSCCIFVASLTIIIISGWKNYRMYEFDKIKYGLEVADSIEHLIYTDLDSVPSCETAVLIFNDTTSDYAWLAEQVAPISELYCAGKI